jgi:hypothetical protein
MTTRPKDDPAYDAAIALVAQIDDDDYRAAATEAIISQRVRRVQGFADPAGGLAMRLRREAAGI